MGNEAMPWYVRAVVGLGAWITAIVIIVLGGVFVFSLLELEDPGALAVFGVIFFAFGLWLLRQDDAGVFAEQLGLATAAAGTAMIAGGIAAEAESLWVGFVIALILAGVVIAMCEDLILQFLCTALVAGFYYAGLMDERTQYFVDFAALTTPIGLLVMWRPAQRNLAPAAMALLLAFPAISVLVRDAGFGMRELTMGGTFARSLHILLFLGLAYLHWRQTADEGARMATVAFAIVAVAVCLLLPPGGSAAMLLLMLAFVIGSKSLGAVGVVLQAQFIIRYYYSLEMNLLNKSLLLMAVGVLLVAAWWFMQRTESRRQAS